MHKKKDFPPSEIIDISIYVKTYNILLYFFPNSFQSEQQAFDFYKNFLEKAIELGEDESISKLYKLLNKEIAITISLDMISGLKTIKNKFTNGNYICTAFNFFNINEIKNVELKNEIEKIYNDNWEHLENMGVVWSYSNGEKGYRSRLDVTPYGLDYFIFCADYDKFQHWLRQNIQTFQMPTNVLIEAMREKNTYFLRKNECENLLDKDFLNKFDGFYIKSINFEENNVHFGNKFLDVYMSIQYFKQPEIKENLRTGRLIYSSEPFDVPGYYGI